MNNHYRWITNSDNYQTEQIIIYFTYTINVSETVQSYLTLHNLNHMNLLLSHYEH